LNFSGKELVVKVSYEDNATKITVTLPNGRSICSEEVKGKLSDFEAKLEAVRLLKSFKTE